MVEKKIVGVQATGVYNHDLDTIKGVQLSGVYNNVQNGVTGVQVAGAINRVKGLTEGVQLAGIANSSQKAMHGVQISSLFNYTKNLKGVQIGLINVADTSSGYMLGLINIVKKGYHTLTIFSNEVLPINVAYKTGRRQLYNILLAGFSAGDEKAYSLGFGIGSDLPVSGCLSVATELTLQNFYLGSWDQIPTLYRLQSCLQVHLAKKLSLFAGPAFSLYNSDHVLPVSGYKTTMPRTSSFGWTAGVTFF